VDRTGHVFNEGRVAPFRGWSSNTSPTHGSVGREATGAAGPIRRPGTRRARRRLIAGCTASPIPVGGQRTVWSAARPPPNVRFCRGAPLSSPRVRCCLAAELQGAEEHVRLDEPAQVRHVEGGVVLRLDPDVVEVLEAPPQALDRFDERGWVPAVIACRLLATDP
jgi:hypothetical protein